jgi:Pentapeptide repeats (8 copies)
MQQREYGERQVTPFGLGRPDAPRFPLQAEEPKMDLSVRSVAALILVVGAVGGVVVYNYPLKPGWAGAIDTSLWNYWPQLLIILLLVLAVGSAVGGYFFARSQSRTAQAIAKRRGHDEALQTYLEHIGESLLNKENPLRDAKETDKVRLLARAWTMMALKRMDGDHNRSVLRFLRESQLVGGSSEPVIGFIGAELTEADLRNADLRSTVLLAADIAEACLIDAQVSREQLAECRSLEYAILPDDAEHNH